jgi:LmbE family N-acetylglucosaminyl deacetylase
MKVTRRNLLVSAGGLASGLAMGANANEVKADEQNSQRAPARKIKVIVCGGHPGDPEYGCGGTVAHLTQLGHEVVLLYLNDGGWPPTPPTTRLAEAKKACEILKARAAYAGQANGHAVVDNTHYEDFEKLIAAEKPDAVITQWLIDNHPDHRAITMLAYNAWHKLGQKFALYYYEVSSGEDTLQFSPNRYIDITETEPIKKQSCYAHASQTPDRYYALQDSVALFRGVESGHKRAEAFLLQLQSPYDIFPIAETYAIRPETA